MADRELQVSELRGQLKEIIEQVSGGQRVVVKRYNGPTAALVPLADYLALGRLDAHARVTAHSEGHMHRIVITNISGGEGKSTLARETAFELQRRGYRVALIDTDPQASLTKSLGLHDDPASPAFHAEHTVASTFEVDTEPRLGRPLNVNGVDIWVSNDHLYRADTLIASDLSKQGNLREAVDQLEGQYDFLIIDTKPGITPLLNAAVAAADHILVPVSGDKGMENLDKLSRLTRAARGFSPQIKVALFIPNRYRAQTVLSRAVLQDLGDYQQIAPISRPIRDSVVIGEAARLRRPLIAYQPKADVTRDLQDVVDDLLLVLGEAQLAEAGEGA
ncbi:type II toxin-antitoxin system prevent-host-death family antitoxin [Deinococcus aluminii]|uniref:AAA domain-containing protein n=1 Tax=Deinococcus aluminii TaxID=1656885 RepID=A0ABP9XEQ6_9DEIO